MGPTLHLYTLRTYLPRSRRPPLPQTPERHQTPPPSAKLSFSLCYQPNDTSHSRLSSFSPSRGGISQSLLTFLLSLIYIYIYKQSPPLHHHRFFNFKEWLWLQPRFRSHSFPQNPLLKLHFSHFPLPEN